MKRILLIVLVLVVAAATAIWLTFEGSRGTPVAREITEGDYRVEGITPGVLLVTDKGPEPELLPSYEALGNLGLGNYAQALKSAGDLASRDPILDVLLSYFAGDSAGALAKIDACPPSGAGDFLKHDVVPLIILSAELARGGLDAARRYYPLEGREFLSGRFGLALGVVARIEDTPDWQKMQELSLIPSDPNTRISFDVLDILLGLGAGAGNKRISGLLAGFAQDIEGVPPAQVEFRLQSLVGAIRSWDATGFVDEERLRSALLGDWGDRPVAEVLVAVFDSRVLRGSLPAAYAQSLQSLLLAYLDSKRTALSIRSCYSAAQVVALGNAGFLMGQGTPADTDMLVRTRKMPPFVVGAFVLSTSSALVGNLMFDVLWDIRYARQKQEGSPIHRSTSSP